MYVMVLQEQNGAGGGDVVNAKEFSEHSDVVAFIRRVPSWISSEELGRQVRRSIILDHSRSFFLQTGSKPRHVYVPMPNDIDGKRLPHFIDCTVDGILSYLILSYPILFSIIAC